MHRHARHLATILTLAALLALPATALAAVYQYFSGTLYDGSRVNSTDGYRYRTSNNVQRPYGANYDLTYFWQDGGSQRVSNDNTSTFTLYPNRSVKAIVQCGNVSGTNNINVSCWTIQ